MTFEYRKIQRVDPMKNAKTKKGKANPTVYPVISVSHVDGSLAAIAIMVARIGPIQGDHPAEKPIPKTNDPKYPAGFHFMSSFRSFIKN